MEVDDRCTHPDHHQGLEGEYYLKVQCTNCDEHGTVILTKGHAFRGGSQGPACPECGCNRIERDYVAQVVKSV